MAEETGKGKLADKPEDWFRQYLGTIITFFVLAGVILFIWMGFRIINIVVDHHDKPDLTENLLKILQTLFTAILPLFGTWIGTVLAFYYTKENLQAANQSVRDLVEKVTSAKKLEAIKAKDVMIPVEKLKYKEFKTSDDASAIKLKDDLLDFLGREGIQRAILLDENKNARYALHRSIIERFITLEYFKSSTAISEADNANGDDAAGAEQPAEAVVAFPTVATLDDLIKSEDDQIKGVVKEGIQFINIDATLAVAKSLMNNKYCQDVFITKGGQSNEPVLGWITNKTIEENSIVD